MVEILGPWLMNKGDDLMLRSIVERLGSEITLCARHRLHEPASRAGFPLKRLVWPLKTASLARKLRTGSLSSRLRVLRGAVGMALAPDPLLKARGWIRGRRLSAVLDCSGFAYGDAWPVHRIRRRIEYVQRARDVGARLIMLPQALGPFSKPDVRAAALELLRHFDLIYARDDISRSHALSLGLDPERVRSVPDITHLLDGAPPPERSTWARRVCIVPNMRMIDRTETARSDRYIPMLVEILQTVRKEGFDAIVVLHESNDRELGLSLCRKVDFPVPVLDEDARITKGILGSCHAVIGSRYHSLVGSLSQATPVIGTSWSHKYDVLFEEYGVSRYLLSPTDPPERIRTCVSELLDSRVQANMRSDLSATSSSQKGRVQTMWEEVEAGLR